MLSQNRYVDVFLARYGAYSRDLRTGAGVAQPRQYGFIE
jgi:hypothetical protein